MTQPSLLQLAQAGNPSAIAALINRHAKHQGVTAHVSLRQDCLYVLLEGQDPPVQAFWSRYLERAIGQLGATAIAQLHIYGRCYGSKRSAWSETVVLGDNVLQTAPVASTPTAYSFAKRYGVASGSTGGPTASITALPTQTNAWSAAGAKASLQKQSRGQARATTDRSSRAAKKSPKGGKGCSRWQSRLFQTLRDINAAMALQWFGSMLLVGGAAAGVHVWGGSSAALTELVSPLPPLVLALMGIGALGWFVGQVQATLLSNWLVSSDRWTAVTVAGALLAYCAVRLTATPELALPTLAIAQWTALRHWQSQAYGWIVVHTAAAIAAALLIPLLNTAAAAWGGELAQSYLGVGHDLTADLALLWVFYSVGSAIAVGKVAGCD